METTRFWLIEYYLDNQFMGNRSRIESRVFTLLKIFFVSSQWELESSHEISWKPFSVPCGADNNNSLMSFACSPPHRWYRSLWGLLLSRNVYIYIDRFTHVNGRRQWEGRTIDLVTCVELTPKLSVSKRRRFPISNFYRYNESNDQAFSFRLMDENITSILL